MTSQPISEWVSDWLFNVTCNGISVIQRYMWRHVEYVQMRRSWTYVRAPNALDILEGSLAPVKAPTRDLPFYGFSEKPPILVAFYDAHWDTEDLLSSFNPRVPTGVHLITLCTNFITLMQNLTFKKLRVVSMVHLRRCGMPTGNCIPQTPSLSGSCICNNCWDKFSQACRYFPDFQSEYLYILFRFRST